LSLDEFEKPAREQDWTREQRAVVLDYLDQEQLDHAAFLADPIVEGARLDTEYDAA
jgi:hypothetical protein